MKRSIFGEHRPRRRAWLAGAAVVALTATGVAIAGGPSTTTQVSATFTATTVMQKDVQTCTGVDGTYEITHATYSGTAVSSDPHLNGPVRIDVKSVYNTTKSLGWLSGKLRVDNSTTGDRAHGNLSAVNVGGQLQGFLSGEEPPGESASRERVGQLRQRDGLRVGSARRRHRDQHGCRLQRLLQVAQATEAAAPGEAHPPRQARPPEDTQVAPVAVSGSSPPTMTRN